MSAIPVITADRKLFNKVRKHISIEEFESPELVHLKDTQEALDYMNMEMPELVFLNFSEDSLGGYGLLESIMTDPWLLHAGIIALCSDYDDTKRLEKIRGANIVTYLLVEDIARHLPRVMGIIVNNRRILFQRQIESDLVGNISGSFKLDNDPVEANCYANLICNFLYNCNKLDIEKKDYLYFSINEMLMNAIEHGNCGITYEEKTAWLEEHGQILNLIEEKCKDPAIGGKRVTFEYTLSTDHSRFFVADEGEGFDWRAMLETTKNQDYLSLHGRGITVTKKFVNNLLFNEKGNEVSFEFRHQTDVTNVTPGLFRNMVQLDVTEGDTVFKEGEPSDHVCYIVKGRYDVIVGGRVVSTLGPDDVFMGEMSFLLNNRRSAAVKAASSGRLIKISKQEFVEAIKKKPHYALFLSRLLAQRIQRLNRSASRNN
ncbi:MAG: cyclic nucleotide-binding domain-containing protein [Chitinivibrionales bacterium]|nr:cyclic nucleotide-binding domain-containing protein [Chitinivibrionales bacterium]MBD3396685.1 cyclic nucleotide-binding domain-containing protein [Chitinivibrionales bacterium]